MEHQARLLSYLRAPPVPVTVTAVAAEATADAPAVAVSTGPLVRTRRLTIHLSA